MRAFIYKTRGLYPLLSLLIIVILKHAASSRVAPAVYLLCLVLSLPVLAFRVWAAGFVADTARAGETHADVLITSGPYAYLRHPMYLSAAVLGLLFVVMSGLWYSILIWLAGYVFVYFQVISYEEEALQRRFGQEYEEHSRRVPGLVPAWNGYGRGVGVYAMKGETLRNMVAEIIALSLFWLLYWWL